MGDRESLQKVTESGLHSLMTQTVQVGLGFGVMLAYVAWKLGKSVLFIDPKGTSQHCWNCLNKVPKELSERWHSCQCGESLDRDENSAKLIRKIGLNHESGGGTPSLKKAFEKRKKKPAV